MEGRHISGETSPEGTARLAGAGRPFTQKDCLTQSADSAIGRAIEILNRTLDPVSAEWLSSAGGTETERKSAEVRLHDLLQRIARGEVSRRSGHLGIAGPELDDLAHQAAAEAMVAITAKLGQFRGESRFTTWAYMFAMFEVSTKIGRHFLRNPNLSMDAEDRDRLPDRFGFEPAEESEWRELVAGLHRAVDGSSLSGNAESSSPSSSMESPSMPWSRNSIQIAMPSTSRFSMPGVSYGEPLSLTVIWELRNLRGS